MKSQLLQLIAIIIFCAGQPLALLAVTPSEGCHDGASWKSGTYTLDFDGIERTFRVHVPRGYSDSEPTPMVAYFHGWGSSEDELIGSRRVRQEADRRGYVLVAPRGLGSGAPDFSNNSWTFDGSDTGLDGDGVNPGVSNDTEAICDYSITPDYSYPSCAVVAENTCSWTHCRQDDIAFAVALVEHVGSNLCIDTERRFAAGGSNGGMFTWNLGQVPAAAATFSAIAPLIGLPHRAYLDPPAAEGDLPAIVITGTRDRVVPPGTWDDPSYTTTSNGSDRYYYTGATAITMIWAAAHGCDVDRNAVPFDEGVRKADCRTYCDGDAGWPRVLDCRARMGHSYGLSWSWPLILDFFDAHSN